MPLIDPVAEPDEQQRDLLAKSLPGPDGAPLNIFRTLARVPQLMKRVNALGGYWFVAAALPVRDREIVILRVAGRTGCDYEAAQHRWLAAEIGLRPEEIAAALDHRQVHAWSERDRLLLAFVDEVLAHDRASEQSWQALHPYLDGRELLELTVLVGHYRMLAGVLNTLGVELDQSVVELLAQGSPDDVRPFAAPD